MSTVNCEDVWTLVVDSAEASESKSLGALLYTSELGALSQYDCVMNDSIIGA